MRSKEELQSRIDECKSNLRHYSVMLIKGDESWYDEAVRFIDHHSKHLNALEYALRVYDEVVE